MYCYKRTKPIFKKNEIKIIQISACSFDEGDTCVYGLGNDGKIYWWSSDYNLWISDTNKGEVFNKEFGTIDERSRFAEKIEMEIKKEAIKFS